MSINVGQIFIQHQNLNLTVKVAAEYLRIWQREVFARLSDLEKDEQGAEHFLEKRTRRIAILPPLRGWSVAIEQVRFLADGDLARHLSEGLGCKVVWVELQGGALGWAGFEFENGRLVRGKLEPLGGREPRLVTAANEAGAANLAELEAPDMPVYPADPERAAWNHLLALGLPREYLFVYPADFTRLNAGGDVTAGFLTLKDSFYGGRLITSTGPARLAVRGPELPCRPDLLARSGGEPVAVHEVRLLAGRPRAAALDSAFAAELGWRRRAFSSLAAASPGRLPEILFRYKDPGMPDLDLDAEMDRRRSACGAFILKVTSAKDLLARRGFAARAAEVLNARGPGLEARPDEAGNLTVRVGGESALLELFTAYRRYLLEPAALEAQVSAALEEFEACRSLVAGLAPADRQRLGVLVRPAAAVPPDAVGAALGGGLAVVAAVERSGRLLALPKAALGALGLTEVEALGAAKGLLDRAASAAVRPGLMVGAYARLEPPAGLGAASLLAWPGLAARLAEAVGGEAVAAAPSAGTLLYAPAASAADAGFRAAVAEEFDQAAEPVSDQIFRLTAQGLEPV